MDTTIQLVTESLYREPMVQNLLPNGYQIRLQAPENGNSSHIRSEKTDVFILQAHLWPSLKYRLNNSNSLVMLGSPSWFYCWFEAIQHGVSAYVTPFDSMDTISGSLEWILEGNHYLSATMIKLIQEKSKVRQEELLKVRLESHLTQSELEVLMLIGEGFTTSEIAAKRIRSEHTVKTQRKEIRRKLEFNNGERLASFAGREIYVLKSLYLIDKNIKLVKSICENTP